MFDTYQVGPRSIHASVSETRNEHRAPTDESVRLLREMEQKALESVVGAFRIENNTLSVSWHVIQCNYEMDREAKCRFLLNGKSHEFTVALPEQRFRDVREIAQEIHRKVTEEVARVITADLFIEAKAYTPCLPPTRR